MLIRATMLVLVLAAISSGCIPKERSLHLVFQNYNAAYERMDLNLNGEDVKNISGAQPCGTNTWCKDVLLKRMSGERTTAKIVGTTREGQRIESNAMTFDW